MTGSWEARGMNSDLVVFFKKSPHVGICVSKRDGYNTTIMNTPQVSKSRRQMLEEFVAKNPADAFGRYGLAMECMKTGDSAAAEENFKELIDAHADYVAAYFQYGNGKD